MLPNQINDLIVITREMGKQPGANKKRVNKTIARLEEAIDSAEKIFDGRVLGIPTPDGSQVNPALMSLKGTPVKADGCTCRPGVVDNACPVHGQARHV